MAGKGNLILTGSLGDVMKESARAALSYLQSNEERYHQYMLSYSPIQQVRRGVNYPSMLLVSGLNDPRVAYWEPTKWAQVLRERVPNGDEVLLKMDMAAGHFSASDRYKKLRERAFEYAWLLDQLGKAE
jgi:oligopeptidase B